MGPISRSCTGEYSIKLSCYAYLDVCIFHFFSKTVNLLALDEENRKSSADSENDEVAYTETFWPRYITLHPDTVATLIA